MERELKEFIISLFSVVLAIVLLMPVFSYTIRFWKTTLEHGQFPIPVLKIKKDAEE